MATGADSIDDLDVIRAGIDQRCFVDIDSLLRPT
jgi:hypothetical protein